ncbi:unnamed protein product [Prunus armeniaca]
MSSSKILLTIRWYVAPAFFRHDVVAIKPSVSNECRMFTIRGMHGEPNGVGDFPDKADCLKLVYFDLHSLISLGVTRSSLLSYRFGRRGDAEFVADDVRGDARHIIVRPGENFRIGP